jgi:RND superfamily putative drug exporter
LKTRNLAQRAGHWSAQHRKIAIFGWIAFVVIALAIGSAAGGLKKQKDEDRGAGDSKTAQQIVAKAGLKERASEQILIQARGAQHVADAPFRAAVKDVEARLRGDRYVTQLTTPYQKGHSGQASADERSALVLFQVRGTKDQAEKRVAPILKQTAAAQRAHPQLRIEQFGDASSGKALNKAFQDDFKKAEVLSLPVTLIILLIAFGALVAAGLPILLGMTAVAATLGLLGLVSQVWPVDESINSVVLLIGLAVGIDYSLFYIRREREERAAGRTEEASLEAAAATSGRAVLISGLTVMAAMAGMYITGNSTFISFGTGTIMVVAIAMLGSITVLPAVLSKLGDRIDKGRIPFVGRLKKRTQGAGAWGWVVDRVMRHPVVSVVVAGGALVALSIPAFSLHTIDSGVQGLPPQLTVTKTLKRIQAAFPGGSLPAQVVVQAKDVTSPEVKDGIRQIELGALGTGMMREPIETTINPAKTTAIVTVPLDGSGTDSKSIKALKSLRGTVLPQTIQKVPGTTTHVAGITAGSYDFNQQMKSRAPLVFAFVLGLAFLLLMVTFRSIVIPLKAIVLNLLSVGAAYGVLVLVFQKGNFESLLGFKSIGGIVEWLPLFLFVILFGLSMDYHVLILSRIREAFDRGEKTEDAVASGIKATAGVVTSAAFVMVFVFGIFATLSALDFKMMGVGLATAILIDATIVRAVLLPASMKLLGDWNWYLPKWLDWLPHIAHEPALAAAGGAAPAPVSAAVDVERSTGPGILTIDTIDEPGLIRLRLQGELDLVTAGWLAKRLAEVEATHPAVLVIDLRGLRFMDSSGLRELFSAQRRARKDGRRLVLVKGSAPIDRVLEMVRAEGVMETVTDPGQIGEPPSPS